MENSKPSRARLPDGIGIAVLGVILALSSSCARPGQPQSKAGNAPGSKKVAPRKTAEDKKRESAEDSSSDDDQQPENREEVSNFSTQLQLVRLGEVPFEAALRIAETPPPNHLLGNWRITRLWRDRSARPRNRLQRLLQEGAEIIWTITANEEATLRITRLDAENCELLGSI